MASFLNRKRSGFTLIELLVVVIIVAVLAAVGIPLLSANVVRAKASEAEAGLGTIRTALRAKVAETGTLPTYSSANPTAATTDIGFNVNDLRGRYFVDASYSINAPRVGAGTYCISVDGGTSFGPGADTDSKKIKRSMDEDGKIWKDSTTCS